MRLTKTVGMVLCLLVFEAQAFDAIKVDQAVRKLIYGFSSYQDRPADCDFSYSYESIRYVQDVIEEKPIFELWHLPDDVEVELAKVDFCTWSDGYWIMLRADGQYNVTGYTSDSQPE